MPESLEDQAHVDQILAIVTDAVAEGRLAFHPKVRPVGLSLTLMHLLVHKWTTKRAMFVAQGGSVQNC